MTFLSNCGRRITRSLWIGAILPLLAGCALFHSNTPPAPPPSPESTAEADQNALRFDPLRIGDAVRIEFSGTPVAVPSVDTTIKGDGTIRLDFIGDVKADGKTPGELERSIQKGYVPTYYTHMNVTVTPGARFFYVQGEVNNSSGGRIPYTGQITVTRAIAAAGDFNPFANRRKVLLYRVNGTMKVVNCVKALDDPKLDLTVYPGDKIVVRKRLW